MIATIKDIVKFKQTLMTLVMVDLRIQIATTRLGYVWWFLDPLILMAIYYFMIGVVFNRGGPGYHIFILSGIVVWQPAAKAIREITVAFTKNATLIKSIKAPLVIYVLSPALVNCFFCVLSTIIVLSFNLDKIGFHTIFLIPMFFIFILIVLLFGMFLSVFDIYIRDTHILVAYGLRIFFYASPILYQSELVMNSKKIPDIVKTLYFLNPIAYLVPSMRTIIIHGKVPDMPLMLVWIIALLALNQLGFLLIRKQQSAIPKML